MSLTSVLLQLGVAALSTPVTVTIDACVGVDAEEVRRLTATELANDERALTDFEVLVGCRDGSHTMRLFHVRRGVVDSRVLAPGAVEAEGVRNRELALAIAELLRRAPESPLVEPNVAASQVGPADLPRPAPTAPTPPTVAAPVARPLSPAADQAQSEVGVVGTFLHWTGGGSLFGADLLMRVSLGTRLWTEIRAGGRSTLEPTLMSETSIDAKGVGAALGLGYAVTPPGGFVDVRLGARVGGDWLRFFIADDAGAVYGGADAGSVHALGTLTALTALSGRWHLNVEVAAGGALHSIAIRDGQTVSGLRGMMASGALGMVGRF